MIIYQKHFPGKLVEMVIYPGEMTGKMTIYAENDRRIIIHAGKMPGGIPGKWPEGKRIFEKMLIDQCNKCF